MSNHQNKSLSLLEGILHWIHPHILQLTNLQAFKHHFDLEYSLHYGTTSLNHVYNNLS